jgi:hypothetical protein
MFERSLERDMQQDYQRPPISSERLQSETLKWGDVKAAI